MRKNPYITVEIAENRDNTNQFVWEAIKDSFVREYVPDQLLFSELDSYFILYMPNKRLLLDIFNFSDYSTEVDVYLYGKQLLSSTYNVTSDGTDITISFNERVVDSPFDVLNTDFIVKANICEIPQ